MGNQLKKSLSLILVLAALFMMLPTPGVTALAEDAVSMEGKIVLPFWMGPPGEEAVKLWWEKWVDTFNRQSETLYVDLQYVPSDAWESKMKAAQATGSAPQLAYVNYATAVRDAQQGTYKALNDYLDPNVWEDVYDNIEAMCQAGGQFYIFPHQVEPYNLLFYRKDLFAQAGLDPEAPPTSWEALRQAAKALTTPNTFGMAIAGEAAYGWTNWGWEAMFGKNLLTEDWSASNATQPEFTALIELYQQLTQDGSVPLQPLGEFWDILPLAEGRVAMQMNGSWAIARLKNELGSICPLENIGVAAMPTPDGVQEGRSTAAIGGYGLAIDGNAKNPEACAEFIQWLLCGDPAIIAEFFQGTFYSKYTARASVDAAMAQDETAASDPWLELIAEKVIPFAQPEPIYPWDVSAAYATAMGSVIVSGMPAADAIAICDQEIAGIIEAQGLAGQNPRQ